MKIFKNNYNNGFTLIELLVVVAIIGILASVVLASLNSARSKARDAFRMQTLDQYSKALELYYDTAGHYPIGGWYADCWIPGTGNWIADSGNYAWNSGYIPVQVHDPVDNCLWPQGGQGAQYDVTPSATYAYWSDNGQRYIMVARLEQGGPYDIQNAGSKCFDGTLVYNSTCGGFSGGWTNPRAYIKSSW